jgi:hypothetical protein
MQIIIRTIYEEFKATVETPFLQLQLQLHLQQPRQT